MGLIVTISPVHDKNKSARTDLIQRGGKKNAQRSCVVVSNNVLLQYSSVSILRVPYETKIVLCLKCTCKILVWAEMHSSRFRWISE